MTRYISLVTILMLSSVSSADIPNAPVEELREKASHIVLGKVTKVYRDVEDKGQLQYTRFAVEISVEETEKGEAGKLVYARMWKSRWVAEGPPEPGFYGHRMIPGAGQRIRVYLNEADDGGYNVRIPNGLEIIRAGKEK